MGREHRDDPPAKDRHDDENDVERRLRCQRSGKRRDAKLGEVHRDLARRQRDQERDEEQVAPPAAFHEGAGDGSRDGERKRRRYRRSGNPIRGQHEHATREPEHRQGRERGTGRCGKLRPVAHGGEEEPGHHREREPEEHFVRMPDGPGQIGGGQPTRVLGAPERDRCRREEACQQIEGAEAETP